LQTPLAVNLTQLMVGSRYYWLITLGLFMGVSWIANKWAMSDTSIGMQYLGLGLYTLAEAFLIVPLLYVASVYYEGIIQQAGLMTGALFLGLTAVVFVTRKDFSFLGPILGIAGMVAIGVIVSSILFGFDLGTLFSALMILFAGGAILYDTSNVLHHYRTDQHVAASLSLFASVILLFWYVLRLLMSLRD
ncbi:MAG: Bax inhibitor-1/YccA family protein, partial [Kiritimatiellia bacterium]